MSHVVSTMKLGERVQLIAAATLLCLSFISGGDSAEPNLGMMVSQIVAIPVLLFAIMLGIECGSLASSRWAVFAVLLIVLLPLLQLLPLPAWIWNLSDERVRLLQDLKAAGATAVDQRGSLSPIATERSLYFMLPGLALFFSMLALGRRAWRAMLVVVIILSICNLALAFAQVMAGQQSAINPYPDFTPALGGIFANRNHQADLLAISLMLVATFMLQSWKRRDQYRRSNARIGAMVVLALIFIFSLPLVGSRAGVIVAMLMLMGVLLSSGLPNPRAFLKSRYLQIGSALILLLFVVGLYAALAWMQSDAGDSVVAGSRSKISAETIRIGNEHAPLGAGIGSFIATFQRDASDDFLMDTYINNAHNEYAQWWLEGGVLSLLAMLVALIAILKALVSLLRQHADSSARTCGIAAILGIGVVLLHSTVDYPLRTQALMAVFAVLSGVAIAAASSGSSTEADSRYRKATPPDKPETH